MAKHQQIRDQLEKGSHVNVLLRVSDGVVKRKPAVVVDVKRAAATVRFEHEVKPRTVRFNELELATPSAPATPVRLVSKAEPRPAPPSARREPTALEAWLEMGAEIEEELEQRTAELRSSKAALEAEQAAILEELDEVTERYAEAHRSLEAIRKIRRAKAS